MNATEIFPADLCLKCSTCNTVCPVYAVEDNFLGPKFIGPELARLASEDVEKTACTVDFCSGCRQCELACPAGVKINLLAAKTKELQAKAKGTPIRNHILGRNQLISSVAAQAAPLANRILGLKAVRSIAEKTLGITERPFPSYNFPYRNHHTASFNSNKKVAYFIGCYGRYMNTKVPQAVVKVLERAGIEVVVPSQKCCGVPLVSNGLMDAASQNATYNIKILSDLIDRGYDIITSCPSCALSLKQEYAEYFELTQSRKVGAKVFDIVEYLLELISSHEIVLNFSPIKQRLFYHQPCHQKIQAMGLNTVEILRLIPELVVENGEQKCCGQAGTYGFKKEKYPIALKIGQKLFSKVMDSKADAVVTECGMCALQLSQGTSKDVYHPLEIISSAISDK